MFVILVYDVSVKRVTRMLKVGRKYLTWVQNSVLEGEISEARLNAMRSEIKDVINEEADSVTIYRLRTDLYLDKETMGKVKGEPENII